MNQTDDHDLMDIVAPMRGGAGGGRGALAAALALLLAVAVGGGFAAARLFGPRGAGAAPPGVAQVGPDDLAKRSLTAFVERFLPAYYGFSYTLYDQSVARAESMMTPAFQAAYNQRAEDLDFRRTLAALKVSTEGIRILPGSFAFSSEGDRTYVRLAGTMTYSTGINGATGDFPLTLLLAVQDTGSGFLVDNVERLR